MLIKNSPKISVIIPVYNVQKYIVECIESVLNQEFQDFEIICIEDCSTDDSFSILSEYQKKDERIFVFQNEMNLGLSMSRNRGIGKASGEYIYFLDSDDMITKAALKNLYSIAKENDTDIIFFDGQLLFESNEFKEKFESEKMEHEKDYKGVYIGVDLFAEFQKKDDWNPSVPRQFIKNNFLKENKVTFYEGILHEDVLFSFLMLMYAKRAMCINEKFFIRRYRVDSIMTSQLSVRNLEGHFISYYEILFYWMQNEFSPEVSLMIGKFCTNLLRLVKNQYAQLIMSNKNISLTTNNNAIQNLFENLNEGTYICHTIDEKILKLIKNSKSVYIYGAGAVARDVLLIFDKNNIGIKGFIVTNNHENINFIQGHKVFEINELKDMGRDCTIIIGTSPKYYVSIEAELKKNSFNNYLFAMNCDNK